MTEPTLNDREAQQRSESPTAGEPGTPPPPVQPMLMMLPPSTPRKPPSASQVAWGWLGVFVLMALIMSATGWLLMTAWNNWVAITGQPEVSFLQGVSVSIAVSVIGFLLRLSNGRR